MTVHHLKLISINKQIYHSVGAAKRLIWKCAYLFTYETAKNKENSNCEQTNI